MPDNNKKGFGPISQSTANDGSILTLAKSAAGLKIVGESGEIDESGKVYGISSFLDKSEFPHSTLSDSGGVKLLATRENLQHLIDSYNIGCRYNKISKSTEINIKGQNFTVDNEVNAQLSELSNLCARNQLPKTLPQDYILNIADINAYNPILEWIESKPWDGVDRLSKFIDTVVVADKQQELKRVYLTKWLMCAVAMLHNDGQLDYEGVLVFQGPQGIGKTKWVKRLLPQSLREYIDDGTVVEPRNKDTVFTACSHWIAELGELDATFKTTDISDIKRFITKKTDKLRRPYAINDSNLPRRTVFFGSVNETAFLKDKTGNRRFWVLAVMGLKSFDNMDMQQLWSQALNMLNQAGGCDPVNSPWYLTDAEQLLRDKANEAFTEMSPTEEMILERFSENVGPYIRANATQVAHILHINNVTARDTREIGITLRKWFGEPKSHGGVQKYKLPFPKGNTEFEVFGALRVSRCKD